MCRVAEDECEVEGRRHLLQLPPGAAHAGASLLPVAALATHAALLAIALLAGLATHAALLAIAVLALRHQGDTMDIPH